ncbi:hypothetical protein K488DRAFT_68566 [Vararia minispora EC-137]|uniref:Uncharacterized protein n=1 Tax=Vararia minispora EC-137 TaxID=1314806 RepID=A0ACB8QUN2_9AGAM|nr:hypothetical protein K488DRAFT_68566 [Vararia minispora EC-137]
MAPLQVPVSAPQIQQTSSSSSRSRTNARKKPNDDAPYPAPASSSGQKRNADRADGESRTKRTKRTDDIPSYSAMQLSSVPSQRLGRLDGEQHGSLRHGTNVLSNIIQFDFSSLSTEELHRYLCQHDLVPSLFPSPLTAHDPPPPAALLSPRRSPSPLHAARDPSSGRRRSSRMVDDHPLARTPILADVQAVHGALAQVAQRHAEMVGVRETDTLAAFVAVRTPRQGDEHAKYTSLRYAPSVFLAGS